MHMRSRRQGTGELQVSSERPASTRCSSLHFLSKASWRCPEALLEPALSLKLMCTGDCTNRVYGKLLLAFRQILR